MLTEAIIQTSNPTSLKIDDVDHDEILILKSISNLSSVKVTQFMGDFAREGSYYQGRRAEKRNPVFNFKLNPNYQLDIEVGEIRRMLHRMFMEPQRDSDGVQVLLKDTKLPDIYFIGYTETIETDAWTKDQTCSCSLLTTDAYLRSADLTQAENALGWYTLPFIYEGSADTGIELTIKVLVNTPVLTLKNGDDLMTFAGSFVSGDILTVNTIQGQRAITLNGVDSMSSLISGPEWLQLKEQGNILKVYGPLEGDGRAVITSYSYRAAWWGI
jgi:hypothetical protein